VRDKPSLWLPLALAALVVVAAGKPPVVDEESYLHIAAQIADHPLRPYDWWRRWQPWGAERTADAFLYAHPPLHLWWVSLCQSIAPMGWGLRLLAGLPPALLLGWSAGRILERSAGPRAVSASALLWLGAPVLIIATQSGLMIDLGAAALTTAAAAAWLSGRRGAGLAAGALLGLAGLYKYPSLVLAGAILWDAGLRKRWREAGLAAAAFAAVWGAVELYLAAVYGRLHLPYVLATALEIARGPMPGRATGVLLRLGLITSPLLLLGAPGRLAWGVAGALAGVFGTWGAVDGAGGAALAGVLGAGGGLGIGLAVGAARRRGEEGFLGMWALLVAAGVIIGHNYASARYLLPAALPLAALGARAAARARWVAPVAALSWGLLGVSLGYAEHRQAAATEALAAAAIERHPAGRFTGEWTLRWALSEGGWTFWVPGEPLEEGAVFAAPRHASPAPIPAGLTPLEVLESPDRFPLRLIDLERGVGYHAETLGALPFGWSREPLEVLTLYQNSESVID